MIWNNVYYFYILLKKNKITLGYVDQHALSLVTYRFHFPAVTRYRWEVKSGPPMHRPPQDPDHSSHHRCAANRIVNVNTKKRHLWQSRRRVTNTAVQYVNSQGNKNRESVYRSSCNIYLNAHVKERDMAGTCNWRDVKIRDADPAGDFSIKRMFPSTVFFSCDPATISSTLYIMYR